MRTFFLLICCMFSASTVYATCKPDVIPPSTPDSNLSDSNGTVTASATTKVIIASDNTPHTVSDKLMWKKCLEGVGGEKCDECENCPKCKNCSPTLFTWQQALRQPGTVNKAGFADHKDWRLPTLAELRSLVEVQCYDPAINLKFFPNTPSSAVWSISPYADAPDSAWVVNFYHGLPFFDYRIRRFAVRLVRDSAE
jgi:hypothetical protein